MMPWFHEADRSERSFRMTIEERMDALEREYDRVKRHHIWLTVLLCLAVTVLILDAAAKLMKTREIRARKIVLTDAMGIQRVCLTALGNNPGLQLYDDRGICRGDFVASHYGSSAESVIPGPEIHLRDTNGRDRLWFAVDAKGPRVTLNDEYGNARLIEDMDNKGPGIAVYDGKCHIRAAIGMFDNCPVIKLNDEHGAARAYLGTTTSLTPYGKVVFNPESSLVLYGPDGKVIWQAP
jgi:hypothetical protein